MNQASMKIGIIIPSTSYNRDWNTIKESYLYNHTLNSFLLTYDKQNMYKFYIGIDRNDRIYDNVDNMQIIKRFCSVMTNIEIDFIYMDNVNKGHLTVMWNKLFKIAFDDGCDYFFQCGDDIEFKTKGWISECINQQIKHNNIGVTGPVDINNMRLLTQSFVSRNHMELFGYYFPPEIVNWFCDDWINEVYKKIGRFYPIKDQICINVGGKPRYDINNQTFKNNSDFQNKIGIMRNICTSMVNRDLQRIKGRL
jgi:hypothetical protein